MKLEQFHLHQKISHLPGCSVFSCGAMDHCGQEFPVHSENLCSVFIMFSGEFYKYFSEKNIKLVQWKKRGKKYIRNFITYNWEKIQDLPFFGYILTANGKNIYEKLNFYIQELNLGNTIEIICDNGENYHQYKILENGKISFIKLKEKISIGALHIAHFIIKSFIHFKGFCHTNNVSLISDPFQIYHDFFPSRTDMGFVVNELISLSQYHSYRTQTMNIFHWTANYEQPCQLLTDNLAGLFQYFSKKNDNDPFFKEFIAKNRSILCFEKW